MQSHPSVADILERETDSTIPLWLERVNAEPDIITISLSEEDRGAHLPAMFRDVITRLRASLTLGTRSLTSDSAYEHGILRHAQGYTGAMMIEESRILQVSIFETLQMNVSGIDSDVLMLDVMAITDEVDSQLAQAMSSFTISAETMATGQSVSYLDPDALPNA
ncbi:hypothetical protein [Acidisarcina polymorpha]|uniref:hypothetical protein n=1 Tax=Acidisarcina polymorpha TaxID=2211140 RepID=UPI000DEFFE20|nr:hypothetical protein [Acidisarcina polymorpha]